MLQLVDRAPSKCAVRKDMWVRIPPAAPLLPECHSEPVDAGYCVDPRNLESDYVHLLGVYLGDGMLTRMSNKPVWKLRLFQDAGYEGSIAAWQRSMLAVCGRRVTQVRYHGHVELVSHWKHWICLFPQHGAGPKHARPIELADWQRNLVQQFPHELLKGLIESDGCRITNWAQVRGTRYEYPRYFFSNQSPDIRGIFTSTCDLIGIEYRFTNPWQVSVARCASVAALDEFIGPKR